MRNRLAGMVLVAGLAAGVASTPAGATHTSSGYWMLSSDGRVFAFGGAAHMGHPGVPSVDIEPTRSGHGYWVLGVYGTVYSYGDADWHGGGGSLPAGEVWVSMSALPDGSGYWLFTNRGRAVAKGAAGHYGDASSLRLNGPVLDSVATRSGRGYWMVASDGGVFSFGDARFFGSMGGKRLNKPVMSLAPDPDGVGYWLVASDGGIFSFDAPFYGSTGSLRLNKPVSGMVAQPGGYLLVAEDGGIFAFGATQFHGSLGGNPPPYPVLAVAAIGDPPVYDWQPVMSQAGSGDRNTAPFNLNGNTARLRWSCGTASAYSAGCIFTVNNFHTGSQLDYASGNPNQSGERIMHPSAAGTFYVEISEYSSPNDTTWSVAVDQLVCARNCY